MERRGRYAGRPLRIGLIGTRGAPCRYGGFETCVEEVGRRLAARGHEVTVYCRSHLYDCSLNDVCGMEAVYLPCLKGKALETLSHTFMSVLHAMTRRYDVCMVFNAANAPMLIPLRLLGRRLGINPDGLEWKRGKWGRMGRAYYKLCEKLSCLVANRVVTDSKALADYYLATHGAETETIVYGAYPQERVAPSRMPAYGIAPGEYFLQITRFEPENHPLLTVRAFAGLPGDKKLVLVGGCPYPSPYAASIAEEGRHERIVMPGYVYDRELLAELWTNAFAYVHGNEVGGTNPALLQAMAAKNFILCRDVSFNREVLGDCGRYYQADEASLREGMLWALDHAGELQAYREKAFARVTARYDWDQVALAYEDLFVRLARGDIPWRARWPFPGRGDSSRAR